MPTLDFAAPDVLYTMMKGEPGTRKSTQALSYPKPQYWFSWDRKMNGIWIPCLKWNINMKDIQYDDYDDWNHARDRLEKFVINCPFRTLVLDSLTSMADMTLRQTVKLKYGTTRRSGSAAGKQIAGIAVNEIEDYNAESSALQELISLTKDICENNKVNIVLIAHVVQAEYRNTATNETHVSRTIVTAGKKVAPKIPAYCGEVYHFNIKKAVDTSLEGDYTCITQHTGDDFARTALPLDRVIPFNDKPLYEEWIKPALDRLKNQQQNQQPQQQAQPLPKPNISI